MALLYAQGYLPGEHQRSAANNGGLKASQKVKVARKVINNLNIDVTASFLYSKFKFYSYLQWFSLQPESYKYFYFVLFYFYLIYFEFILNN